MKKNFVFYCIIWSLAFPVKFLFAQNPDTFFGKNLLKNPGAESPKTTTGITGWKPMPDTNNYTFMSAHYGEIPGEWAKNCDESCGLPPDAGKSYFRLPTDAKHHEYALYQDIDLSALSPVLKTNHVSCDLMAVIAGLRCPQHGCASGILTMIYYGKDGKEIKDMDSERDNFELIQVNGNTEPMRQYDMLMSHNQVPENATRVRVVMKSKTGDCCVKANIFFDNVSLTFTKEAELGGKK